ncbi:metalloregulator ArsR/SmtB family transcription factor [Nocardioides sp. KR10-350]|uniref:ArsR/SmtB family transcription factor n=1 Tax=Nocardioides cheoyonin TaxID=3156615 RepID=UPI0032B45EC3
MHALDVLGDPVRRHILDTVSSSDRPLPAGEIVASVQAAYAISQPAVSQHLKVLRESGFLAATPDGRRRLYALRPDRLQEADAWLAPYRRFWTNRLSALETELRRGRRSTHPTSEEDR